MLLPDSAYFGWGQDSKMSTHSFVSESLRRMVQELELTCSATANGEVDVESDRGISIPVDEIIGVLKRFD